MPKQKYICDFCGLEYEKQSCLVKGKCHYCCRDCRYQHQKETMKGENNPNYGGGNWSDESKANVSKRMTERMKDPEERYRSGSANRGKKFSDEIRKKMSEKRKGIRKPPLKDVVKKVIGEKSKAKWTEEYKQKHRQIMESLGIWYKLEDLSNRDIYYQEANWICKMFDIIPDDRLKEFGVWNLSKNKGGLVRDHRYSRRSGLINKVFPELLRHPFNCQLLTQSENVSKSQKGNGNQQDSISLEELFDGILNYQFEWVEQDICIKLIEEYKQGNRWFNKYGGSI